MKKTLSLILAIMLLISMFSVSVVAFAEDSADSDDTTAIEFVEETDANGNKTFDKLLTNAKSHTIVSDYQLDTKWLLNEETVKASVKNINYALATSKTVSFKDTTGSVSSVTNESEILKVSFKVDSVSYEAELKNSSYNATAENPLVGTWTSDDGKSTLSIRDDGTANGKLTYGESSSELTVNLTSVAYKSLYAVSSESDTVQVQYLLPSKDSKDDDKWTTVDVGKDISISTSGWWRFRYVVKKNGESAISAKSSAISVYFYDDDAPVVTGLGTSMSDTQDDGVEVGKTYSVRTSLSITDKSSTTVTYVIYRKENGEWKKVYDSTATTKVVEGYEDRISSSAVITFMEDDVLANKEPIYKIVYTVTDSMGYVSEYMNNDGETPIEMTIFANAKENEAVSTNEIISYVLFGVAGLAFIGIIVVLFIKPKDSQTVASAKEGDSSEK